MTEKELKEASLVALHGLLSAGHFVISTDKSVPTMAAEWAYKTLQEAERLADEKGLE